MKYLKFIIFIAIAITSTIITLSNRHDIDVFIASSDPVAVPLHALVIAALAAGIIIASFYYKTREVKYRLRLRKLEKELKKAEKADKISHKISLAEANIKQQLLK